ncbi:hypothetical protein Ait01nite_034870 [Actinoplanes italicus]|uniref:Uncharacterized protein n=1 Tax=Actinoplanes italicus TaxID=113567 RepID=A0A2T0K8Z2_9ACTN|nr:hypothetical protein [Actinoplanes italicus]PRX19544.1 hypothetical protein CLV67_110296 [Actinoplanes italicus]GIE30442.1 hypothetical protein Ait01nite_034870 [Actinoplanes italicus]
MKRWGVFLIGGGCGLATGASAGDPAVIPGLVAAALGAALLALGGRSQGARLIEDATAGDVKKTPRPTLSGLGTRVEDILRLAEEQAHAHVAAAEDEARQIVARANAEARRIEGR